MGEWGSEEQLIDFGREGEILVGAGGISKPSGEESWIDVLADTKSS